MRPNAQFTFLIISIIGFMAFIGISLGKNVTISNIKPRTDTDGIIMDIHDGESFFLNGLYYYYGASYGLCEEPAGDNGCADFGIGTCGFRLDHNVSLFTSPDLVTWTNQGHVFRMQDHPEPGILFCPKVVYNAQTDMFVLWYNWLPAAGGSFSTSLYGVATSQTPAGPFIIHTINVTTLAWPNTGDLDLFVDDDGEGYIIYTAEITAPSNSHRMSIEKLAPDYLSSLGVNFNTGFFGQGYVEAPVLFKRSNTYYALFGSCCCYCQEGSPVGVYTSASVMGPYQMILPELDPKIPAQQTNVLPFETPQGMAFLWQGDRWQSAPDGIKGHDFSYWGLLQFDNAGNLTVLEFTDSFTIDVDN